MPQDSVSQGKKQIKEDERRSVQRVDIENIPVEIFDTDGITILGIGYISNLGINCAGLETTINLSRGREFFMRFMLEKKYMLNVWASVARIVLRDKEKYYGVKFTKTDIVHEKDLKGFLELKLKENKQ